MNQQGPDYQHYSLSELEDALSQLDRERFPDRFQSLQEWIEKRREEQPAAQLTEEEAYYGEALEPVPAENKLWVWFWQGVFILVLALDFLVMFRQSFVPAAWWEEWVFAQVLIYTIGLSCAFYFFVSKDNYFSRNLKRRSRSGKFTIVFAPFLIAMFLYPFIMYVVPAAGHELSVTNRYEYATQYQLKTRTKGCHFRAVINAAEGLASSTLCISQQDYNSMPPSGNIEISGTRSMWGLTVIAYRSTR
ncbi:hypothetical protein [Alteromonas sp. AMM-1]|uniref:hypothetical protein n=1 Tax=Alteromonas sp. AMM-1 TaxID=3394233 RepID=UPI0039A52A7B